MITKKFVKFLLSANTAEIGVILFGLLLNLPLPLLPLQILWVNLVTDGLPALALGVDNPDGNVMKRKPRSKDETILKDTYSFIFLGGLLGTIIVLGLFYFNLHNGVEKARTIALTSLILYELFLVFSARSEETVFKLRTNKWLFGAVGISLILHLVILYSPLHFIFKLSPFHILDWIEVIVFSSLGLFFFEIKKLIWRNNKQIG